MSRRSFGTTPKWTVMEDNRLREAVIKHGTSWTFITQKYDLNRSLNSIIKRWHGKLKD